MNTRTRVTRFLGWAAFFEAIWLVPALLLYGVLVLAGLMDTASVMKTVIPVGAAAIMVILLCKKFQAMRIVAWIIMVVGTIISFFVYDPVIDEIVKLVLVILCGLWPHTLKGVGWRITAWVATGVMLAVLGLRFPGYIGHRISFLSLKMGISLIGPVCLVVPTIIGWVAAPIVAVVLVVRSLLKARQQP